MAIISPAVRTHVCTNKFLFTSKDMPLLKIASAACDLSSINAVKNTFTLVQDRKCVVFHLYNLTVLLLEIFTSNYLLNPSLL